MGVRAVILGEQCLAELPHSTAVGLVVKQPLQQRHMESIPLQDKILICN